MISPAGRAPVRPQAGARPEDDDDDTSQSWWTARARAEVAPGFTRGEILAEGPFDPAVPGGLFDRLADVLGQLSGSTVTS